MYLDDYVAELTIWHVGTEVHDSYIITAWDDMPLTVTSQPSISFDLWYRGERLVTGWNKTFGDEHAIFHVSVGRGMTRDYGYGVLIRDILREMLPKARTTPF